MAVYGIGLLKGSIIFKPKDTFVDNYYKYYTNFRIVQDYDPMFHIQNKIRKIIITK